MMHIRAQLRAAAAAALRGLPQTRDNVYKTRLAALTARQLPALKIYTISETDERETQGENGEIARSVELSIECVAAAADDIDDLLDQIAFEVEGRIAEDPTFGGLAADCGLESVQFAPDWEGEIPAGVMTLTYRAMLKTSASDASANRALKSGRFASAAADGAPIGRLRSFDIEASGGITDITDSESGWAETGAFASPRWTATLVLTADPADPGQARLAMQSRNLFVFHPRGAGEWSLSGYGIVSGVADAIDDSGEIIRTITITGDGSLA